jgi:hypothetical protein
MECGITLAKHNDLKVGDVVQTYQMVKKALIR